jgi:predicted short-subunit dehydrogenase-like oxidoreductase (DUF2520 family)
VITPSTFTVGGGPAAIALSGGLRLGGVPVLGLWARKPEQARTAGAIAGVAAFSAAPPDLLLEADVILLAVRDESIADVARTLVATGLVTRKHVMVHCSGAISAREAFADVLEHIGGAAAMHPLRAISDPRAAMREFKGTVFGIEGDDLGKEKVRALIAALGGRAIELAGPQMAAYHAAAAIASNYLVALLDVATELLVGAGISPDDSLAALLPLVQGTAANLRERGLPHALTGPIRRGDTGTVARHLEVLDTLPGDAGALYRTLAQRTLTIARKCGDADPSKLAEIEQLLAAGTTSHGARATGR